jgi:cytochrome c5
MTVGSPEQLVGYSRTLMGRTDADIAGLWQRAVAFLTRQALEIAVARTLLARAHGAELCPARAQLLCLPEYISTVTALEAAVLWGSLSRACHQHPYELAPTWEELAGWLDRVERVASELERHEGGT